MWKPLIRSAVIGGIVVFIWYMFSWLVLPWHNEVMHRFDNEQAVASALVQNSQCGGVYVVTSDSCDHSNRGLPFIFASIVPEGREGGWGRMIVVGVITQIIGAFFITWLLLQAKAMRFWHRVRFIAIIGFVIGFLTQIPGWNWWGFSLEYSIINILDILIAWFIGGLVIAKLVKARG